MTAAMQWRYVDSGPAPGEVNMAADERLLGDAASRGGMPVLRLYAWEPPAVSLGRFQDEGTSVDREACRRHGIDIVRRITGGRAVLHRHELTYAIVAPDSNSLFPDDVIGTYKVIAAGLLGALRSIGVPAEMVSHASRHAVLVRRSAKDPSCFASPSWYELVVHGRKIIGSAQRRVPGAFLQHGSILLDHDPALEAAVIPGGGKPGAATSLRSELGREVPLAEVKQAVRNGFTAALGIRFVE